MPPTFTLSLRALRSHPLRTSITIIIMALGIMALVGIITALEAMHQKFTESFSTMGANGFVIRPKERNIGPHNGPELKLSTKNARKEKRSNLGKPLTIREAEQFRERYQFPAKVSISTTTGNRNRVTAGARSTSPDIYLFGSDEQFLSLNGFGIIEGRNFSREEIEGGREVCLLGYDVAMKLFRKNINQALKSRVKINGISYQVIGVLAGRGAVFGFSRDKIVITGYRSIRKYFPTGMFTVGVKTADVQQVNAAMAEAEMVLRSIRKLPASEQNNFILERSNAIAEKAISVLSYLSMAVIIIGLITLAGSSIGLMNIMLVAVTERTKEIGLIKAIGGTRRAIELQFLTESILISCAGAVFGIILGIAVGNIFSMVLQTGFVMPWRWVVLGMVICTFAGTVAGLYPALKAGKLSPIEALRYE